MVLRMIHTYVGFDWMSYQLIVWMCFFKNVFNKVSLTSPHCFVFSPLWRRVSLLRIVPISVLSCTRSENSTFDAAKTLFQISSNRIANSLDSEWEDLQGSTEAKVYILLETVTCLSKKGEIDIISWSCLYVSFNDPSLGLLFIRGSKSIYLSLLCYEKYWLV